MKQQIFAIFLLICLAICEDYVCQPSGLVSATSSKYLIIENFYHRILDRMGLMQRTLNIAEKLGELVQVDWRRTNESLIDGVGLYRINDSSNVTYWGDRRSEKYVEIFLPSYFLNSTIHYLDLDHSELVPAIFNTTEFCTLYNPPTTYQPIYCRNSSYFNDDMLNFDISVLLTMKESVMASVENSPQILSSYIYTSRGSSIYAPILDPDLGHLTGGSYAWEGANPLVASRQYNPTLEGVYSTPYRDFATYEFIITAFYPIYMGEHFWGVFGKDITMMETRRLIEEFTPTKSAFSILVNSLGFVILGSAKGLRTLLNVDFNENSGAISILSSNVTNLRRLWPKATRANTTGIDTIIVNNTLHYVAYQTLQTLKGWVFFVFAPVSELTYLVSINTTIIEDELFLPKTVNSFSSLELENRGVLDVKYRFATPTWLIPFIGIDPPLDIENRTEYDYDQTNYYSLDKHTNQTIKFGFYSKFSGSGSFNGYIILQVEDLLSQCYMQTIEVLVNINVNPSPIILRLDNTVSTAILIVSFVSLIFPLFFIFVLIYHRKRKYIHSMSPPFSTFGMVGTIFLQLSPIFLTNQLPYCTVWWWFVTIGFVTFFGSMIVKTYRVERIFTLGNKLKKAKNLTNKHLFPLVIILLVLQIILLIVWTILAPLELRENPDGQVTNIFCGSNEQNAKASTAMFAIQGVYAGILIISGCYYSFKTRNIVMKSFNEAKEMMFAIYNFSLAAIMITGLVAANTLAPTDAVLVLAFGTLWASIVSSVVILGRKFYLNFRDINKTSSSSSKSNSRVVALNLPPSSA